LHNINTDSRNIARCRLFDTERGNVREETERLFLVFVYTCSLSGKTPTGFSLHNIPGIRETRSRESQEKSAQNGIDKSERRA
jgi:hypothetical protein